MNQIIWIWKTTVTRENFLGNNNTQISRVDIGKSVGRYWKVRKIFRIDLCWSVKSTKARNLIVEPMNLERL